MFTSTNRILPVLMLTCLSVGCASVKAHKSRDADLTTFRTFYIVQQDGSDLHQPIEQELMRLGYSASSGAESSMPYGTSALVTFDFKWQWDMTMYLIEYEISFKDPATKQLVAYGKSYRPSLQRKEPAVMAAEIPKAMFETKNI